MKLVCLGCALLVTMASLAQTPSVVANTPPLLPVNKSAPSTKASELQIGEARERLALDLLRQSHALVDQLKDDEKIGLMEYQAKYALIANKELGRQWAHELFDLGSHMDSDLGSQAQLRAMKTLSRSFADEALEMLEQIDPHVIAPQPTEFLGVPPFGEAEREVFLSVFQKHDKSAMPAILHTAAILGSKGRYPYWPVMSVAVFMHDPAITASDG